MLKSVKDKWKIAKMSKLSEYKWSIEIVTDVSPGNECEVCKEKIHSPLTQCWKNCTKEYMKKR